MKSMELASNEIHLWLANQVDFPLDSLQEACIHWLSDSEMQRHDRFCFQRHKKEYLTGQMLLRSALSHYADVLPHGWRFRVDEYGKPGLDNYGDDKHDDAMPLHFNLSHSGDRVVLAVSRIQQTGVDIEAGSRSRRVEKIATRYFSPPEVADLLGLPEQQQQGRFYELWTLKEAYIKARGMGLVLPLQEFGFAFPNATENRLGFWVSSALDDVAERWRFWQLETEGDYKLALAVGVDSTETVDSLRMFQRITIDDHKESDINILRVC